MTAHATIDREAINDAHNLEILTNVDQALEKETTKTKEGLTAPRTPDAFQALPHIMRILGASAIVISAVLFMLQGLHSVTFIGRHFAFLGISGGLGALGLLLGLKFNEHKGARVLLGLSTASLPVLFSQLGGMIHAHLGVAPPSLPHAFQAIAESVPLVIITNIATFLIAAPLVVLGFHTLARSRPWLLSLVSLGLNGCILFPSRESHIVGLILCLMTAAFLAVEKFVIAHEVKMRTSEGLYTRLMLLSPMAVIFIRTLFFEPALFFTGASLACLGSLLFAVSLPSHENTKGNRLLRILGTVTLVISTPFIVTSVIDSLHISDSAQYLLFTVPAGLVLAALSAFVNKKSAAHFRGAAAIYLLAIFILGHIVLFSSILSLVTIIISAGFICTGAMLKERISFITGMLGLAMGIISILWNEVSIQSSMVWVFCAVCGTAVIAGASFIDIRKKEIAKVVAHWKWVVRS